MAGCLGLILYVILSMLPDSFAAHHRLAGDTPNRQNKRQTCKILIARTAPLSTTLIQYLCLFFAGAMLSPAAAGSAPNMCSNRSILAPYRGGARGLCLFTRISIKRSNPDIHQTEKRVSQTEGPLSIFLLTCNKRFISITNVLSPYFFIRRIRRLFKSMHINARLADLVHLNQGL